MEQIVPSQIHNIDDNHINSIQPGSQENLVLGCVILWPLCGLALDQ